MFKYEHKYVLIFSGKEDIQLNKAWKVIIKDRLGAFINKTFENSAVCDFSVNICMDYENNLEVIVFILFHKSE